MVDSDSSLSSPPATDDELAEVLASPKAAKATPQKKKSKKNGTILSFFTNKSPSPVRKKRAPSPPHEMVPEDNPDIAFIVMFRSRFSEVFPPKTPHFGPQDVERGVAEGLPTPQIETLLCSLLALLLNRKKPIEKGHHGRALEEAIAGHRNQWPLAWQGTNPLSGGRSFNTMSPVERITLLKTIILWALHDSDAVNAMIKETYKARTTKDKLDTNIPLSVQPWGRDGDNRRYWLVEGQDDTSFRVYRESNIKLKNNTWWSVAGSIDEIRVLAQKLVDDDGTRDAKQLSEKMRNAIPRFEATEEKRKRREYRVNRQAAFARPEPGFSLYEGRTRGKRMKYTFSDEEEEYSDALGIRRSNRTSGRETPAAPAGPTVTASGRHVKSRATGMYGESLLSGQAGDAPSPASGDYAQSNASDEVSRGRPTRATARGIPNGRHKERQNLDRYNSGDEMDDEDDATSWDGGDEDDDEPEPMDVDDEEDESGGPSDGEDEPASLIVSLRIPKGAFQPSDETIAPAPQERILAEEARIDTDPPPPAASLPKSAQSAASSVPAPLVSPAPAPAAVPPQEPAPASSNGAPLVSNTAPVQPVAPMQSASAVYSVPTPPYVPPEDVAPKPEALPTQSQPQVIVAEQAAITQPVPLSKPAPVPQYPVASEQSKPAFQATPIPQPTAASTWQ